MNKHVTTTLWQVEGGRRELGTLYSSDLTGRLVRSSVKRRFRVRSIDLAAEKDDSWHLNLT
jgi:hypothetical protein